MKVKWNSFTDNFKPTTRRHIVSGGRGRQNFITADCGRMNEVWYNPTKHTVIGVIESGTKTEWEDVLGATLTETK